MRVAELIEILVRQSEPDAELPQLRGHRGESQCGEVLELVHVEKEGAALWLGHISTGECSEPNRGDEQTAEHGGGIIANRALGEIDEEHLALVEDGAEPQTTLFAGQEVMRLRIREERADLVLDRRDRIGPVARGVFLELLPPEPLHRFMGDVLDRSAAIGFVGQEQ